MLDDGNPPDGWEDIMKACASSDAQTASDLMEGIKQAFPAQE